jgi:hypothetical protein
MQPDRVGVAGALVQVVDVLRDHRQHARVALRERGQRAVTRVGLGRAHAGAAFAAASTCARTASITAPPGAAASPRTDTRLRPR